MTKKEKYDLNAPGTTELVNEIVHGTFMTEGSMAAFPFCFPGASAPPPPQETRITALDIHDNIIYGGTSGLKAHLFCAMFHGVTGIVFDLGAVANAVECKAIACVEGKVAAAVNTPDGAKIVSIGYQGLPFDLIQEWGFGRGEIATLCEIPNGDKLVHAVYSSELKHLIAASATHLYDIDPANGAIVSEQPVGSIGKLGILPNGHVIGFSRDGKPWRYRIAEKALDTDAIALPAEFAAAPGICWTRDPSNGKAYVSDDRGVLYSFNETAPFFEKLAAAPLGPVTAMSVTADGRLFGECGEGIQNLFNYSPKSGEVKNLGVAVSVLQTRRYGYNYGASVTGRDGQIFFGEDDNNGHLWIYFPKIQPA